MIGHGATGVLGEGQFGFQHRKWIRFRVQLTVIVDGIHVDMNHLKHGEVK